MATGALLSFVRALTTPLAPDDYLDVLAPLQSSGLRGRIVAINPETRDAVTVVIKTGLGWTQHIPGQYIRIGVDVDGVRQWRTYSMTSDTGRTDGCVTITVKAMPGGLVSNYLVRRARIGTVVQLDQPTGDFTLAGKTPSKLLFVTAGSGITPAMGILRNLDPGASDIVIVHSAPTREDVIFGAELRHLAQQQRIELIERHTDSQGMLDASELSGLVPDYTQRHTMACGPEDFLNALEEHWAGAGISKNLYLERFRFKVAATGDGGTVVFNETGTAVEADGTTPLLEVGEEAGVLMPSGCRSGICRRCVVPLNEGAVQDLRTGAVTTAGPGEGVTVQTCVSAAAGPCNIDV